MLRTTAILFFSALLLMHASSSIAGNLCSEACQITVDFTDGGQIIAVEPVTITFGESGFINDGVVTTAYASGETVSLASGESISFGNDGRFDIGFGGNIDYTDMEIIGDVGEFSATGGEELITIYRMKLSLVSAEIKSDTLIVQDGSLIAGGDVLIYGDVQLYGSIAATGNLTIYSNPFVWTGAGGGNSWTDPLNWTTGTAPNSGSNVIISNTIGTDIDTTNVIISSPTLTIDPPIADGSLSISGGSSTLTPITLTQVGQLELNNITFDPNSVFMTTLTQENLPFFEGLDMFTADGGSCTVTDGECFTDAGAKYIVNADGELVPAEGSSRLSPILLFVLMCWMLLRQRITH